MPTYRDLDWYEQALYYDLIFDLDTAREADFLEAIAQGYGRPAGRRVLEPACGTGRLVRALAERGYQVAGFDLSQGSLDFARERLARAGREARLWRADMASFRHRAGSVDLAHCLVSTFKFLADETSAVAHLERVARALAPGGLYVLGLHLSDYAAAKIEHERWVAERDGTRVVCNIRSWPPDPRTRTERVRSRLTVDEAGAIRRYETRWLFRTYDLGELRALLAAVPALEHVATYDFTYELSAPLELDGERFDVVLVLRKRDRRR